MVEKVSDFQREGRVGGHMNGKVGSSVGTTKKESSLIISSSGFFGCVESPKPHSYLLCGVLDLGYPFPRWPLSHTNKLVFGIVGSPLLEVVALFVG